MMGNMFGNSSKEEGQKMMNTMMEKFFHGISEEEMLSMKNMCNSMCTDGGGMQSMFATMMGQSAKEESKEGIPSEARILFDEWKSQIAEEIEAYKLKNKTATTKEIAENFRLSERSVEYFLKSAAGEKPQKVSADEYEVLKVRKTKYSCSLCENYVKENLPKPVVVMSCEGACLRGEIARKSANILCHSLAPEKTARLCLGSALTKDAGQRQLVLNAKKIIALEGCPVDCGSRLLKGLMPDIDLEVIRTDALADFNSDLFGINELSEEETNKCAKEVAEKLVQKL